MNPRRRELIVLGGAAAAAGIAGAIVGALALQSRSGAAELLASTFPDVEGKARRLAEWHGRPLLVNFWATWCAPCRDELPLLDAVRREYSPNGFEVVGIAMDRGANVQDYLRTVPVAYPVLVAGGAAVDLIRRLGNPGAALPFSVALDRSWRLRQRKLGAYSAAELHREVAALLS